MAAALIGPQLLEGDIAADVLVVDQPDLADAASGGTSGHNDQKSTAERLGEAFKLGEKTLRRDASLPAAIAR